MKLTFIPKTHPDQDAHENYAFGRLSEDQISTFEEHLLICEKCQVELDATVEYIRLMKVATGAQMNGASPPVVRADRKGLRWNVAAAALILLTCLSGLLSWRAPSGEMESIVLDAYRGKASDAPAWQPLELQIDLRDAQPASGYRVEVIDREGHRLWFGGTPARLTKGLAPGLYWVRLSTDRGEPLREYGLNVGRWK
jgi:hypothetical protein